ncbi:hypothetical protein A3J56_01365 [Candidatus Giovannonibacteria bacterium RIFCSPHIGHO2_02_FULL_46_20]|uniref:DNA polymerase III subunit delta n=1 Tax=Candidatus Giovannonibacteria bacterium RIFCSPHIGHO2_02_FULL_46_20 TaxID=1798338 RepID=A0A1F5WGI1_9BACT|nr:MAG: hypothetical protein A3J56_01365 [Candidatus Giovannonibacteria bacterium RIFCSPHIGHO2_02_FULL_46_20]
MLISDIVRKQLSAGIFLHAYLLWGGDEVGKESALREYIELLLGKEYLRNPNFFELLPDTESGSISINAVRAMRSRALQTPFNNERNAKYAPRQVFVMRAIERISRDASPLLLKILEDPPSGVVFLATTNNLERLSKPLRSRFSLVRVVCAERSSQDNTELARLSKLSLKKRWENAPKLLEGGDFERMLRSAILEKERAIQEGIIAQRSVDEKIRELEQLWQAYQLYQLDPTASKRLIGEYALTFI